MSESEQGTPNTSSGRRYIAMLAGLVVFIICIAIAAGLIGVWLGTGSANLSAAAICWLVAGFIGAVVAGFCTGAIARDADPRTFFYVLVTALVLMAIFYAVGTGAGFGSWLRSAAMVIGGTFGAWKVLR